MTDERAVLKLANALKITPEAAAAHIEEATLRTNDKMVGYEPLPDWPDDETGS